MSLISVGGRSDQMAIRDLTTRSSEGTRRTTKQIAPWILEPEPAKALVGTVREVINRSSGRLFENMKFMSIYANKDFMYEYGLDTKSELDPMPRMSDNQIRKQVETTVGKLVQSNSRVTMMTNHGNFSIWNRARKIEQALQGEWARMKFFAEAQRVAVDGLTVGNGWLKLFPCEDNKRVMCERVFPNEVFVDEVEAAYGAPTKMYQVRYVSKDTLAAQFPSKWDVVEAATPAPPPRFPWCQYNIGMIEVIEGWALPVGDRPGRHVICTTGGTLIDEEWDEEVFPFVHFKPGDAPFGFYGQGWVEQTMSAQILLNKMLNIMERGAHLSIAPFWVVADSAGIDFRHLDNVPGHVLETGGQDAKWVTNAPFHQAAPVYCDLLRKVITDFFGNNEMDTGSGVPINRIDSKKALREFSDLGAARITTLIERWSNGFFLDAAERTMVLAKRIAKQHGTYPVLIKSTFSKAIELDWKDLDQERNAYLLTPAPANLLSQTPSGKLDDIKELMEAGLIDQKKGQKAMMGPDDINALLAEATATEDDLDWVIEQIVEKGNLVSPSSIQDLKSGLVRMSDAFLQYRTLGLEQEKLSLFEQWLEEAQGILQDMQTQHAPEPTLGAMPAPIGADQNGGIPGGAGINPATGPIPAGAGGQPALGGLPAAAGAPGAGPPPF